MTKTVDFVIFEHLAVFIFLWEVLRAEDYVIIQRKSSTSTGNSTWKAQPDQFIIPSSLCVGNGSKQCKAMGGSRISNCKCECNHIQASISRDFSSSTFGLDGGRWKCLENAKVHERSGCSVILNNWANDSALITVPNVGVANYEIPTQFPNFQIYKATSKAQNCDNSWMHLDYDTYVKERFSVHGGIDTKPQYLKFNYSGNSSQKITTGRIIKLGVGYHDASSVIVHSCILLKMQGEIKCPFSLPPTATPSTKRTTFSQTTVESRSSTSTRSASNPNTHTTSSGSSTVTMSTDETSLPMVVKTSAQNTSSDDSGGLQLIAGAVAGVIGLIALVIVIILVRRRKKSRKNVAKRTSVVADQEQNGYGTNRVQQSLEDDQEEYSYAYASAVSISKRNVDHHSRNKGAQNGVTNSMYGSPTGSPPNVSNVLKNPDYAKNGKPQQQVVPIHNIVEPEYAKVNKTASKAPSNDRDQPLYYVLEGPDGPNENEPPCYHVLEGPYSESDPFYDILEEPGSMARLPNQNSALDMPNARSDVEENRGYNDTVYDSVEEVIPYTGDIYQQLNQSGQQEPGVYQALGYENHAMPLTKLNGTHSEA